MIPEGYSTFPTAGVEGACEPLYVLGAELRSSAVCGSNGWAISLALHLARNKQLPISTAM